MTVSTGSSALRRTFCTFLEVEEKKIAVSLLAGFATSKKNCDLRGPPLKYKSSPTMRLPLRCGHSPQMVMVPTAIIKRAMDARARAPADDIVQFTRTQVRFRPICKDVDSNRLMSHPINLGNVLCPILERYLRTKAFLRTTLPPLLDIEGQPAMPNMVNAYWPQI